MVDTTRLEEPRMNSAGGPVGPSWWQRAPRWARVCVVVFVLGAIATISSLVALGLRGSSATGPPVDPSQVWTSVGYPSTSVGGGEVYTRCAGPHRLILTVDAQGMPVGPAGIVLFEQGSGCPR